MSEESKTESSGPVIRGEILETLGLEHNASADTALATAEERLNKAKKQQQDLPPKHPSQPKFKKDIEKYQPLVDELRDAVVGWKVDKLCEKGKKLFKQGEEAAAKSHLKLARAQARAIPENSDSWQSIQHLEDLLRFPSATALSQTVRPSPAKVDSAIAEQPVSALESQKRPAAASEATKALELGLKYRDGNGIEINFAQAMYWFRKAAEAGSSDARRNIGLLYENGQGVQTDYAEAMKWYIEAADAGDSDAQYNVGLIYANGYGVETSHSEAMKWFRKAADSGSSDAQKNIGVLYELGLGVAQSIPDALNWYRKSASSGNEMAKQNLKRLGVAISSENQKA